MDRDKKMQDPIQMDLFKTRMKVVSDAADADNADVYVELNRKCFSNGLIFHWCRKSGRRNQVGLRKPRKRNFERLKNRSNAV